MSLTTNLHGDKITARSVDYTYEKDGRGDLSVNPFVTLEISGLDEVRQTNSEGATYITHRNSGSVTVFLRSVQDGEYILAAVQDALRSLYNLELEKRIAETLENVSNE